MSRFVAKPERVPEPDEEVITTIPPEIDVLEEDERTVHILMLQVRVDVTDHKSDQSLLDFTHFSMAKQIRLRALELEIAWDDEEGRVTQDD